MSVFVIILGTWLLEKLKLGKWYHISPVLWSLHWLPVVQRIDFIAALLEYKSLHGLAPKYISDMLVPYEPSQTLRSLGRGRIEKPRVRNKCAKAAFQFCEANIWNNLPEGVRSLYSSHVWIQTYMTTKGILSALFTFHVTDFVFQINYVCFLQFYVL